MRNEGQKNREKGNSMNIFIHVVQLTSSGIEVSILQAF